MTGAIDPRPDDPHGLDVAVRSDRVPAPAEVPGPGPVVACQGPVSDAAVSYARNKVARQLGAAGDRVLWSRVKLTHTTNPADERSSRAAVTVDVDGSLIRAHASAPTMPEAIDAALDRLRLNLERLHDRRRSHRHDSHRRDGGGPGPRAPWYDRPPAEREVVRHKTFAPSRLSLDDALWDLDLLDYDFFLFTEAGSGLDCVVERTGTGFVVHGLAGRPEVRAALARDAVGFSDIPVPVLATSAAVARLEASGNPFELYENAFTGDRNVVYHRYDGHYGVITPPRDQPPSEERLVHEGH